VRFKLADDLVISLARFRGNQLKASGAFLGALGGAGRAFLRGGVAGWGGGVEVREYCGGCSLVVG